MLAKFAEDDRIEQMNAQKRRMKQAEHARAVEKLMEDRRAQFAREREAEVNQREEEARLEEFRKRIIEEERQKLLQQHATKLIGYLPRVSLLSFLLCWCSRYTSCTRWHGYLSVFVRWDSHLSHFLRHCISHCPLFFCFFSLSLAWLLLYCWL